MGLFSGITDAIKSVTGAVGDIVDPISGLLSGGASLLGGMNTNSANQAIAQGQEDFQAQQYATRYQTTVKDMEAAGLNPMLAYSQGPGSSPSGAAIAMQNPASGFGPAMAAGAGSALANAQTQNVMADTLTKLAKLPASQIGGDVSTVIRNFLKPFLDSSKSSASSIQSRDLPPPGSSASSNTGDDVDYLTQLTGGDNRSPLHKFIDQIGAWNPYGLPDF